MQQNKILFVQHTKKNDWQIEMNKGGMDKIFARAQDDFDIIHSSTIENRIKFNISKCN